MRVLRFIWQGVLAFDRIGSRIPQLIQIWLLEFFFAMPLMFFIGKVIDIRGGFGVAGTGESLDGVFWGSLAVSLFFGFFFVRSLVRPKVVEGSWAPVHQADVGAFSVVAVNNRARVYYSYLNSHPSYALLLLITAPIPAVMALATINNGDNTFYWRVTGIAGLVILACMALARVLAWYVFRFGRDKLAAQVGSGASVRRMAWEVAWKPVLMLIVMMYAIAGIPIAYMWWDELRTIDKLPVATAADVADAGEFVRVHGELASEPVYWAPRGTGRGGNNYSGAGVLVDLPDGGQVLLLAESQ